MRTPVTIAPITVALVNDYDIVVMGIAHILKRMWAAPDVAALWRTVVDEAVVLIDADGVAVVR